MSVDRRVPSASSLRTSTRVACAAVGTILPSALVNTCEMIFGFFVSAIHTSMPHRDQ